MPDEIRHFESVPKDVLSSNPNKSVKAKPEVPNSCLNPVKFNSSLTASFTPGTFQNSHIGGIVMKDTTNIIGLSCP
ncbi:MAG: hypothetical protein HBSAPP01_25600 [Candidatus Brocadia sapporoensis]|nr:MAG: hypothetical protein HBSAPP01_25600 [Candidatus Brocadia sapporoensis]